MTGGADNATPAPTAAALAAARRAPPCPCVVTLDGGERLDIVRWLRVLPGKRVVGEGVWNGQRVLAKLFVSAASARHWQRERDGLAALVDAGIPTPSVLAAGKLVGGGHYLLTAFLSNARTLAELAAAGSEAAPALLARAATRIGQLHAHGLVHDDLHTGNFLVDGDEPLVIDGDAVRRCAAPLPDGEADANFARFIAEAPADAPLDALLAAYRVGNPRHAPTYEALAPSIDSHLRWRLQDYLKKTVRPCTLFDVQRSTRRFTAVARGDAEWLAEALAAPDRLMAGGTLLKSGNTATVARVETGGRELAIKRYNIKSAAHALSRVWRPSRAWHSWREGHRLRFLGIDTPAPRALIEERLGPMRGRAWLVTDFLRADNLGACLAAHVEAAPPVAVGEALLRFVAKLRRWRIGHGDFKATNLLWDDDRGEIAVIDLDAMIQHKSAAAYERAWRRDRARLLANWPEGSGLYRWLDDHLPSA